MENCSWKESRLSGKKQNFSFLYQQVNEKLWPTKYEYQKNIFLPPFILPTSKQNREREKMKMLKLIWRHWKFIVMNLFIIANVLKGQNWLFFDIVIFINIFFWINNLNLRNIKRNELLCFFSHYFELSYISWKNSLKTSKVQPIFSWSNLF